MKTRTQILSDLIKDNGYKSYLEIGMGDGANFRAIKAEKKIGVDPARAFGQRNITSDKFFEGNSEKFDLIFIDGDHDATQVEKDIVNAYAVLNKGGMIVLHDVNPPTKEHQIVPRQQLSWTGDVWRAVVGLKKAHPKIKTEYLPEKYGMMVIYKSKAAIKPDFTEREMTYEEFDANRNYILGA